MLTLALGAWHVGRFVEHTRAALDYRYPLDGQEGTLLYEARLLRAGEPLYQPLRPDRVVATPYPPVHYVVLAATERLANPEGVFFTATQRPIFLPGRVLSLAATLSVGLFLTLSVWRIGGSLAPGAIAACLWLAFSPVQLWATRIKPDPLALALTALGLVFVIAYLVSRRPTTGSRSRPYALYLTLAAGAFAGAFFTKQTVLAAPMATALTLLFFDHEPRTSTSPAQVYRLSSIVSRFRSFLVFTGTYALLVATTWIALDRITRGQFTFHVWGLHPIEWWSYTRFRKYLGLLLPAWPLILLSFAAWWSLAAWFKPGHFRRTPLMGMPAFYAVLSTLTLVSSGTTGAHHNHLLEPYLALTLTGCSIAGLHLNRLRSVVSLGRRLSGLLAVTLLLLQLWMLRDRPDWFDGEFELSRLPGERFVALIMSRPGEVLADDVGLLLAAGRPLRYDDPATMGPAAHSGLWDQQVLLEEVAAQRFSLVLLPFDATEFDVDPSGRWTPEFIAALRQHYRLLYRDVLFSYVPRR